MATDFWNSTVAKLGFSTLTAFARSRTSFYCQLLLTLRGGDECYAELPHSQAPTPGKLHAKLDHANHCDRSILNRASGVSRRAARRFDFLVTCGGGTGRKQPHYNHEIFNHARSSEPS